MNRLLVQNGRVIDPSQGLDRVTNLAVEDGRITGYDAAPRDGDRVLDASGKIVAPGLIDMHVHLCEPGREEDETIASGTAAALAGGFTTIACMPDTEPPLDSPASVEFIRLQAERAGHCRVEVIAAVSKGRAGTELSEMGQLVRAGAVAFSDNASPVFNPELMRRALEYCLMFDRAILSHAEARELTLGGVMHEGQVSLVLGLAGIPAAAEDVMVGRDIVLSEATGGRIHLLHLSTVGALEIVRRAKRRNVRVTAEVAPHHFSLTDERLRSFDSNFKTSPPLRSREDVEACIAGLADGTIDVIASDHSPHAREKKMQELDLAPFGVVGLETCLPLVISELIEPGRLDWPTALAKLTCNPARILRLDRGTLAIGAPADITVIDPSVRWTIDAEALRSKSKNTPFAGRAVRGRADTVIVGGAVRFRAG